MSDCHASHRSQKTLHPEDYLALEEKAEFKSKYHDREIIPMTGGFLNHNRVDFERLHIQDRENGKKHSGIVVVSQKSSYKIAQRIGILVSALAANEITNQLLYA